MEMRPLRVMDAVMQNKMRKLINAKGVSVKKGMCVLAMSVIVMFSLGWAFTQNGKDHERIIEYMESKGYVKSNNCNCPKRFHFWVNDSCCEDALAARTHRVWVFSPNKKMRCFEFVFWKKTGRMEVRRGTEYE